MLQFNGGPVSLPAMLDREPRQARKGAAVTVDTGAGVGLAGTAAYPVYLTCPE